MRLAPPLFLREDEMIWQDPVDLSHITYEYFRRYFVGNKDAVAERLAALRERLRRRAP